MSNLTEDLVRKYNALQRQVDELVKPEMPSADGCSDAFVRTPNHWRVPTDHFCSFSGYTWAAYAPFDGAPSTVDVSTYPSLLRLMNDNIIDDHFAYQSGFSGIWARLTKGVDSVVGIRLQDSGNDNNDYAELRLVDSVANGMYALETEYRVGGGAPVTSFVVAAIPVGFYLLRLYKAGNNVYVQYTMDSPRPMLVGSSGGMTWTADRAGIVFSHRGGPGAARAALVDFVEMKP